MGKRGKVVGATRQTRLMGNVSSGRQASTRICKGGSPADNPHGGTEPVYYKAQSNSPEKCLCDFAQRTASAEKEGCGRS